MRLWWAGVIVGWLGAAVLAVAAWSVYRDYHAHHPGAVLAALVGGLTLGLAAVSVGASWRRAGNRYLRGEASVAEGLTRVAGRWLVRRYGRLPGGRAGKGS